MQQLRLYHFILVVLAIASYLTGELGIIHAWLGYGVAALIVVRLLMAFTATPQLGLTRFYPQFENLRLGTAMTHPAISRTLLLGIAVCTIGTVASGVWMDRGRALGFERSPGVAADLAGGISSGEDDEGDAHERGDMGEGEDAVEEIHEVFANLLIAIAAVHVTYLVLFKRPLARFMLFLPRRRRSSAPQAD